MIHSWQRAALHLLAVVIVTTVLYRQWASAAGPLAAAASGCGYRGVVDPPDTVSVSGIAFQVSGWAYDRAGIREIRVLEGERVLARQRAEVPRPDVQAVLGTCPDRGDGGFSLAVPAGPAPHSGRRLRVQAVNGLGHAYQIGEVGLNFSGAIGSLDSRESLRWNGASDISGWVVAASGAPVVRVMAGAVEVAKTKPGRVREDIAAIFPEWPAAANAGFGVRLAMARLPRGRYPLTIRLEAPDGTVSTIPGPEVWNDEPLGKVSAGADRLTDPRSVELGAWVADEDGIHSTVVVTDDGRELGPMVRHHDLADAARPSESSGALYRASVATGLLGPGVHRLNVRVTDRMRRESLLPGPLVRNERGIAGTCAGPVRRMYYPGNFRAFQKSFAAGQAWRDLVGGGCLEIGMRGRVEYLRSTLGRSEDYAFDPDLPESRQFRNGREMTGVALRQLLDLAARLDMPLLVTLDGGVWADNAFSDPDFDVVDMLEEREDTVQWNQFGRSEPDDALGQLAGSLDNPQLARMMSLNRYNTDFRKYKKRNLQAAVREIVGFMAKHPGLEVAINLDPDEYINPWFHLSQWYDYNPGTLRQFREWLFHLGPYADGGPLAGSRYPGWMSLAAASRLAGKSFAAIAEVDPPRDDIDYSSTWQQIWSHFRRHLVAQHYQDLSDWAAAAGMPVSRIYTAQTFIQADVADAIDSPARGWTDQAGVSIQGAKPSSGHLGAILYGPASRDEGRPRSGRSLVDNIRRIDPEWGVVEFHPAVIAKPDTLPSHEEAYHTMLAIVNGGARFISPMWGSRAEDQRLRPDRFRAYDAMEGTAFEYQLAWWLAELERLPAGALLFPFGNRLVGSLDGWRAGPAAQVAAKHGQLEIGGDRAELLSPTWSGIGRGDGLLLRLAGDWSGRIAHAEAILSNGRRLACASRESPLLCDLPVVPGQALIRLRLWWEQTGEALSSPVLLDEVRIDVR